MTWGAVLCKLTKNPDIIQMLIHKHRKLALIYQRSMKSADNIDCVQWLGNNIFVQHTCQVNETQVLLYGIGNYMGTVWKQYISSKYFDCVVRDAVAIILRH